jgi:hypothetical protein
MSSIIDDTIIVLRSMNLEAIPVETPPGFSGIQVNLPHETQAYFVWAKIDKDDFAFRLARFWNAESPFSMMIIPNLIDALARIRELARQ